MRKGSSLTPSSLQSPTSARRCDAPAPNDGVTSEIVEPRRDRLLAVGKAGTAEHVERIVRGWRRIDRKAEAEETT